MRRGRWSALLAGLLAAAELSACGAQPSAWTPARGPMPVVAAENFWGSLASQLGGARVKVHSVLSDAATDPHEYASNPADARAFAQAALVIVNGAGYDSWAQSLLSASPSSHRRVLDVGRLLGKKSGENPHFWYDPAAVLQVVDQLTADFQALDPAGRAYYAERRGLTLQALAPYLNQVGAIKSRYGGQSVGATESIFVYMASALGLNLISPPEFMTAISAGSDPPVQSITLFQTQIVEKRIRILVYNRQTANSLTERMENLARGQEIPVVAVSEIMPAGEASFETWQAQQLDQISAALASSPVAP